MAAPFAVVKLGGSVVTEKARLETFALERTQALGAALAECAMGLVLVHGTGSFGKPLAHRQGYLSGVIPGERYNIVPEIQGVLGRLRDQVVMTLMSAGLPAVGVASCGLIHMQRGAITRFEVGAIANLLARGLVPVLSGEIVCEGDGGFAVCSSDVIAADLAIALGASWLVFATDTAGILRQDGTTITVIDDQDDSWTGALVSDESDVSGGMPRKLWHGFRAARAGVDTVVLDGRNPRDVLHLLQGKPVRCTHLLAGSRVDSGVLA